jgi:hypothetical protein
MKQIQNKMEGHSSKTETEDRISEPEDEMVIKRKTEELSVKQLKTSERNMQELTDSTKRPNLRIMGIEEGEEVQAKGMHNRFNKIITENFPNLEKTMPIQVQEASRTPNRLDQNTTTPQHIIIKTTSTETRERILKAVREKKQITTMPSLFLTKGPKIYDGGKTASSTNAAGKSGYLPARN